MTPKQIERQQKKISDIRRTLAAEKAKFGCYDDSRGRRYLPLEIYLRLGDYKAGLTYTRWFQKAFPDDAGFPIFLFEWTIVLFKNGKIPAAEKMAFKTFCSNTHLLNAFFGKEPINPGSENFSNWEKQLLAQSSIYSSTQMELADFSTWLQSLVGSEKFIDLCARFRNIHNRLETEGDFETRRFLLRQSYQLVDEI